jgi:zinc transporter ZupT
MFIMTKYSSIYSKEGKEEMLDDLKERQPNVRRGLITLAAVGVGMYMVGRITGLVDGYRGGYREGFSKGIIHTVNNFAEGVEVAVREHNKSKGK